MEYNGILAFDKPQEFTSHDVVAKLRGMLKQKRIGHSGTLDPMATGVLLVLLGNATKVSDYAGDMKEYIAGIRFGTVTDTQDIWGTVEKDEICAVTPGELEAALPAFRGELEQIPPMYSAVKIKGQKLYSLARKGVEVERKPRRITIDRLELLGSQGHRDFQLLIRCSRGTYVRTLCHDLGQALGHGACMTSLVRTQNGDFGINSVVGFSEVELLHEMNVLQDVLYPADSVFLQHPAVHLTKQGSVKARHGAPLSVKDISDSALPSGDYCRVYCDDGSFYMTGNIKTTEHGRIITCHKTFG